MTKGYQDSIVLVSYLKHANTTQNHENGFHKNQ